MTVSLVWRPVGSTGRVGRMGDTSRRGGARAGGVRVRPVVRTGVRMARLVFGFTVSSAVVAGIVVGLVLLGSVSASAHGDGDAANGGTHPSGIRQVPVAPAAQPLRSPTSTR